MVGGVVVGGATAVYLVVTTLYEGHEVADDDVAWELALGASAPAGHQWMVSTAEGTVTAAGTAGTFTFDSTTGAAMWSSPGPVHLGQFGRPLAVSNSRAVTVGEDRIEARDLASGEVQWAQDVDEPINSVATSDDVVVVWLWLPTPERDDSGVVVALDASDGRVRWRETVAGAVEGVALHGRYVLVAATEDDGGSVRALRANDGDLVWEQSFDGPVWPVVDGETFVIASESTLVAVEASTGEQQWAYETPAGMALSSVTATSAGTAGILYTQGADQLQIVMIDSDGGRERWRWTTPRGWVAAFTAGDDMVYTIVVDEQGWRGYALDAVDGDQRWSHRVTAPRRDPTEHRASPHVGAEAMFVVDGVGRLVAAGLEDGETLWSLAPEAAQEVDDAPVAVNDTVYFVDDDGRLRAVDHEGSERWQQRLGSSGYSSPLATDEAVYAVSALGEVRAYDAHGGDERWRSDRLLETRELRAPRPVEVEGVVVAAAGGTVVGIDADGVVSWRTDVDNDIATTAGAGATAVVVTVDGVAAGLDADGQQIWDIDLEHRPTAPATASDGLVALFVRGRVIAVAADTGEVRWQTEVDADTSARGTAEGNAVHVAHGAALTTLDVETGQPLWRVVLDAATVGAPAVADDRVYVATRPGAVVEFGVADGSAHRRFDSGVQLRTAPAVTPQGVVVVTQEARPRLLALR